MVAPLVIPLVTAGIGLLGDIFGAKTQESINRDKDKANKEIADADRRFQYDKLLVEEKLKIEEMYQNREISNQDYKLNLSKLDEEIANNKRQYDINLQQLQQQGTISANELGQRKSEMEANIGLSREKLAEDNKLAREQLSQGKDIATAQISSQEKMKSAEIGLGKEELAVQSKYQAGQLALGEKQQTEAERINKARQEAYKGMINKAEGMGENIDFSMKSPEMEKVKQGLEQEQKSGLQAGSAQLQTELAKQGVRGGQAGTQLRRGIGEMTQKSQSEIDRLMMEEAMKREAEKRAYQQQLALTAQKASLTPAAF